VRAIALKDPHCSTRCAKLAYGVPLARPMPPERWGTEHTSSYQSEYGRRQPKTKLELMRRAISDGLRRREAEAITRQKLLSVKADEPVSKSLAEISLWTIDADLLTAGSVGTQVLQEGLSREELLILARHLSHGT
jgi:hypothetical protein